MKNKAWIGVIVAGVLIVLSIVFLLNNNGGSRHEAIKVGILVPLSGGYADVGNWMRVGMELAMDDITSEGHQPSISLVFEDSQSKPNMAISAYQKLKTTQNVRLYISTVSSVCLALKPLVIADKNFLLVNAGHKDIISGGDKTVFRHALTIPQEATFISDYIKANHNITKETKIGFVYSNNDIGVDFRNAFLNDMSVAAVSASPYDETEADLRNIVLKALSNDPKYVVIYGYTKNLGQLIKTFREQHFDGRIFVNQGFSTPSVIEAAGTAGNNVFYSDYDIPDNEAISSLKERVKTKYNTELSSMNITAYNAIILINKAVSNEKKTPEEIADYLKENSPYDINGMVISIDQDGEIYVPLKMVQNEYK